MHYTESEVVKMPRTRFRNAKPRTDIVEEVELKKVTNPGHLQKMLG